jgi:hypothetical protein
MSRTVLLLPLHTEDSSGELRRRFMEDYIVRALVGCLQTAEYSANHPKPEDGQAKVDAILEADES